MGIERWLSTGRVVLIPKEGEWEVPNQRPITCLKVAYFHSSAFPRRSFK